MEDPQSLFESFVVIPVAKRLFPRAHCYLSGYNFNVRFIPASEFIPIRVVREFFGFMGGISNALIVPSLKFRFSHIDPERLKNDPHYGELAYRTTQKVEAWRIGIVGTLLTGVNLDWFSRAQANPVKVATGIVQLTCAIALTILLVSQMTKIMAISALAGALLA